MRLAPALLGTFLAFPVWTASQTELAAVRNVYLLPMSSGFDQYLAQHLTAKGVFQVVTDPEKADALFTDQIGVPLERQFEELYPPPPPPEPPKEAEEKSEETEKAAGEATATEGEGAALKEEKVERPIISSFRRGIGNVFLVGRHSKNVLWSTFHPPKDNTSKQLDKAAGQIVQSLQESIIGQP